MRIKAVALPGAVATALDENADLLRMTLASSAAPSSLEQPSAELSPDNRAAEDDSHTATATATETETATNTDTDRNAVKDTAGQNQHPPNRLDSAIHGTAAAQDTGGVTDPPTAAVALGSNRHNRANGHTSSSSGTAHVPSTNGSDSGSSSSIDNGASTAEDPSDAERVDTPQLRQGNPSFGSEIAPRGDLQGSEGFTSSTGEASHTDRVKEGALAAPVNNADQQSREEGQSIASGKVGILKQRLLAAIKEAKADSPALLKVRFPPIAVARLPPPPPPPPPTTPPHPTPP